MLEVLRQPLEDREITISRALRSLTFPAGFMLAAAMNPCPCGYWNSVVKDCLCTPLQIQRYISKISGPLLDRIDLHIDVPEVNYRELTGKADGELHPARFWWHLRLDRPRLLRMNVLLLLLLAQAINFVVFVWFNRATALRLAVYRQQLGVYRRSTKRPILKNRDRLFWVVISRL